MIAVILNYESQQNPAYRSTLARAFLRDFRSHLFVILPRSLTYVGSLVLTEFCSSYCYPVSNPHHHQHGLPIRQSDKQTCNRKVWCLHYI